MTPWKVVGFEKFKNESGEDCVRVYVVRPLALAEGHQGEGFETQRLYFKPKYVQYEPEVNHLIVAVEGRYGIGQIIVLGRDKN